MSQEAERVYTINLGKVWLSPNNRRAKRAINMIREFATHHMKTEQIKIDQDLSQAVWKRGIRNPPRKIRVKMAKTEEGYVLVSSYEEEKPKETGKKIEVVPEAASMTETAEKPKEQPEQKEKPKPKEQPEQKEKPKKAEKKSEKQKETKKSSSKPKKKSK